jgi:hypothetical protein
VPVALAASVVRFHMLRRAKPHPFGLATAAPTMPRMLESDGWGPGLTDMVLAYGHPFDVAKPLIEVATCFSEPYCYLPSVGQALARAEHRDAAWARNDLGELVGVFSPANRPSEEVPVPEDVLTRQRRAADVDGEQRAMQVVSLRQYEALRFRHGPMVVTAVARWGFPDPLSFRTVSDLEPYFAGHRRFVLSWLRFWET